MPNLKHLNSTVPAGLQRRVMRLPETEHVSGYCDMHLRRLEKAGTFPRRFKLNPDGGPFGAVGHDYVEVMDWLEARRASRDAGHEAA